MKFIKWVVFFIFSICIINTSFAESTHFTVSSNKFFYQGDLDEIEVSFNYLLKGIWESDFIVIPHIRNGSIYIYNLQKGIWVSEDCPTYNLPKLSKLMKVKIHPGGVISNNFWFEILSNRDYSIYKTPPVTLWNISIPVNYTKSLNRLLVSTDEKLSETSFNTNLDAEANGSEATTQISVLSKIYGQMVKFINAITKSLG